MEWLIALVALSVMEIVLGIDNIVFIAILTGRLPEAQQSKARLLGLGLAMGMRLVLLFTLTWILGLTQPVFHLSDLGIPLDSWFASWDQEQLEHMNGISWRDIILLVGGLFLIGKSVREIHHKLEEHGDGRAEPKFASFAGVLFQITMLDIIFSLDSVITAVGMVKGDFGTVFGFEMKGIYVMVAAIVLAVAVMMLFAGPVSRFVHRHPTLQMLALSFLILIGVMLVAEAIGTEINKGYVYFAMAFSLIVELLNLRLSAKRNKAAAAA